MTHEWFTLIATGGALPGRTVTEEGSPHGDTSDE